MVLSRTQFSLAGIPIRFGQARDHLPLHYRPGAHRLLSAAGGARRATGANFFDTVVNTIFTALDRVRSKDAPETYSVDELMRFSATTRADMDLLLKALKKLSRRELQMMLEQLNKERSRRRFSYAISAETVLYVEESLNRGLAVEATLVDKW